MNDRKKQDIENAINNMLRLINSHIEKVWDQAIVDMPSVSNKSGEFERMLPTMQRNFTHPNYWKRVHALKEDLLISLDDYLSGNNTKGMGENNVACLKLAYGKFGREFQNLYEKRQVLLVLQLRIKNGHVEGAKAYYHNNNSVMKKGTGLLSVLWARLGQLFNAFSHSKTIHNSLARTCWGERQALCKLEGALSKTSAVPCPQP